MHGILLAFRIDECDSNFLHSTSTDYILVGPHVVPGGLSCLDLENNRTPGSIFYMQELRQ